MHEDGLKKILAEQCILQEEMKAAYSLVLMSIFNNYSASWFLLSAVLNPW